MHRYVRQAVVAVLAVCALPRSARAEETKPSLGRDELIAGAGELIATQKFCALITR